MVTSTMARMTTSRATVMSLLRQHNIIHSNQLPAAVVMTTRKMTTYLLPTGIMSSSISSQSSSSLSSVRSFYFETMGTTTTPAPATLSDRNRPYSTTTMTTTSQSNPLVNNNNNEISTTPTTRTNTTNYFSKVLIANRGEIAIRIARTCRKLNIPTVAIYTYNDTKSSHIKECDESICIGESYLNVSQILKAIQQTNADAVHPGYGFLSENADFSESVVQELDNVAWLGPPASAIRDMGDKVRSKEIAKNLGIDIIPGIEGELHSITDALDAMNNNNSNNNSTNQQSSLLEYPILLKAAAGGGGKGMRICYSEKELIESYPLAQSEGIKYFADGRLLIEKYIENPHHIEFQVICSNSNNRTSSLSSSSIKNNSDNNSNNDTIEIDVAIFPERECSIQRRNQKIIEESPSCLLTDKTRHTMMMQTAKLCQSVNYIGAGTIEWLVDEQQNIYFLEMNTRLQVEHPVTEAVSSCGGHGGGGIDLVEAMLRVGSGNGLTDWYDKAAITTIVTPPPTTTTNNNTTSNENEKDDHTRSATTTTILIMPWKGHSIESRIYAEDPLRGYLPSTGPLIPYKEPYGAITIGKKRRTEKEVQQQQIPTLSSSSYLRVDSGVEEGHVVTPFYDPMISKIISYAPTRDEAIQVLCNGLDSYIIEGGSIGLQHNARLCNAVLRHPEFVKGNTPTSFLDTYMGGPKFMGVKLSNTEEEELAVSVAIISKVREDILDRPPTTTISTCGGYTVIVRLGGLFSSHDAFSVTTFGTTNNNNKAYVHRLVAIGSCNDDYINNKKVRNDVADKGKMEREVVIDSLNLDLVNYLAHVSLDGNSRTIQVLKEEPNGELKVQMYGADMQCLVQSQREYELSKYMRPPVIEDTSDLVLSPMPGLLIDFSVRDGDHVEVDQELCVVEAMKMQNIIRSPREGTIVKINVQKGAALITDQIIMEFGD